MKRWAVGLLAVSLVMLGGALLRGWLVPASRGDLSPEAYGFRLRWPWAPRAEVAIAFPSEDGQVWVTVRRAVREATPLAALQELVAGPAPGSGLRPVFPEGTQVASLTIESGKAVVRLDGWHPDHHDPAVGTALRAVARALAGHADEVEIDHGHEILAVAVPGRSEGDIAYLRRGLPVFVPADLPAGPDRPAAAVRRLLAGPAPDGTDAMPEGVSLLGVEVSGDLAKVSLDLSPGVTQELMAGRWQFAPHAMAIVYTLTEQPGIRRVQFAFPNLPPEARRNCRTPLGVPLVRPDAEPSRAKEVQP